MADAEKMYPASEEKLESLRREGIFPSSKDLETLFLLIGFLLGVYIFSSFAPEQLEKCFLDAATNDNLAQKHLTSLFILFVSSLSAFVLPICIFRIFSVLIQSRFLISFSFISFNFSKLSPSLNRLFSSFPYRALQFLLSLLKALIISSIFYIAINSLMHVELIEQTSIMTAKLESLFATSLAAFSAYLLKICSFLLFFVAACAMISKIFTNLHFRKIHGMSRNEMLDELRENEANALLTERQGNEE